MALPVSFYGETINDNTVKSNGMPETAAYRVPIITLTAANLTATETLIADLAAATRAITLGPVGKSVTTVLETRGTDNPATDIHAQRENKWLVRYHDPSNGQKFRVSVPTADLEELPDHSELLDLTGGNGLAYKNAFEAVVRSPNDASHSVVVDSVQFVGRNS